MRFNRGKGHLRIGRLLMTWNARQVRGSALIDGCRTTLTHDDERREDFGGVCFRIPRSERAATVGLVGGRIPNPARWRPRYLRAQVLWVLAGRPAPQPMTTGHDFTPEISAGEHLAPAVPFTPEGASNA